MCFETMINTGMKIHEFTSIPEAFDRDEDRLRYKDYFNMIDNPFSVTVYNKLWKSFPTADSAQKAANACNVKAGRIVAFVTSN